MGDDGTRLGVGKATAELRSDCGKPAAMWPLLPESSHWAVKLLRDRF